MGPELISNGSFEDTTPMIFFEDTDDDGNVIATGELTPGHEHVVVDAKTKKKTKTVNQPPPGWFVRYPPITWMENGNLRDRSYHITAFDKEKCIDLTGNGARPNGGIAQFIHTTPGWYQIKLKLGMDDNAGPNEGPVAVDVFFFSLANHLLGYTWFRMDKREIPSTPTAWKDCTDEVFLGEDTTPFEKADEELLDFLARLHHKRTDGRNTMIVIAAHDMSVLRPGNPSHFVGLDLVSVQRTDKPMPGWWRHKTGSAPPGWSRHK